jgi:hypothetical protein
MADAEGTGPFMAKSKVAVLKVTPETVMDDIERLEVDPPPQLGAEVVAAGLIAAPCGRLT